MRRAAAGPKIWCPPIWCWRRPPVIRSIPSPPSAAWCRTRAMSSTWPAIVSAMSRRAAWTASRHSACANMSASARRSRSRPSAIPGSRAPRASPTPSAFPIRVDVANDPFFGRVGALMAATQREDALKFELLVPVRSAESPTACMSFNYHKEHFGEVWGLHNAKGEVLHTGCVAFGMDRLAVALFAAHGVKVKDWPGRVSVRDRR